MSKNIATFKSRSRVNQIIESGTIRYTGYGFLLLFYDYSNFVPKTHRFLDIRLQKCRDLEDRVRGTSTSLKMSF